MIIKRLELVNYCQHTHRVIDIAGNLIAVVGHNGCGKSNMLGALQFALTGEQPGKNKADLLHWGAKEGRVVLEFEQDGKPGRIERAVGANKVTLEYDGVTTSGITNVAREMEERLHMDKDLVRQSVFVRQTEVDTIISVKTDKRDREVAFQKLLGIDAAKIHKNLTDWMYAADKPLNFDIQLTDATKRLGELEARKAELDGAVAKADADIAEFGEVDCSQSTNLSAGIAAIAAVLNAQANVSACADAADRAARALADRQGMVSGAGEDPGVDIVAKLGEISALQEQVHLATVYARDEAEVKDATEKLAALQAAEHPSDDMLAQADAEKAQLAAELAAVDSEIGVRKRAQGSLDGTESVCPVCGSPLDADLLGRLNGELRELEPKSAHLRAQVSAKEHQISQMRMLKSSHDAGVLAAQQRVKFAQVNLDKAKRPVIPADTAKAEIAKAQEDIGRQRVYDDAVADHKAAISKAELAVEVTAKALADARQRLQDADAHARTLCGAEAAADWSQAKAAMESLVAETDRRRAQFTELQIAKSKATAARDEVVATLAKLVESVNSLKLAQQEQDYRAKKLAVIERVRDWFSYQNGPRVLVQQVLAVLTDDVNRFLGNFTAPFVVIPDHDQLGFKVQFTDGRDRPEDPPGTDVLSGGERVQLAVAFRLAIYCMFAGKLGLLSLDEPTAYLDDGNVDRFGILLGKVRELARNMNTQVFMATHERAVIPHMDSVIDLN